MPVCGDPVYAENSAVMLVLNNHKNIDYRILMDFGKIADTYYPHFIVVYKDTTVKFSIDMKIIDGELPVDLFEEVRTWANKNYRRLEKGWLHIIDEEINSKFHRKKSKLDAA